VEKKLLAQQENVSRIPLLTINEKPYESV